MNVKIEVEIPSIPNFIMSKVDRFTISLSQFSEDELTEIGKMWTQKLIEKSKEVK